MSTGAHTTPQGGWPDGWVISLVAGVIAAVLGRWIGETTLSAAVLVGVMVFLVFGVLLGMFWTEPPSAGSGAADKGHDHH